ncbi:glycoside hydrolase family 2 TIM barrel-domain containing protein [uncultured Eudoraea sp.]|uniref:glycoside hydrolase family 2 TIM barrel-domain containing protein n=1 Tax=uncultured Eudoraea sp. TaxID=1035614 RepID=UPI00260C4EBE|nr:glycoside hydrolase family 2 TIM barrel-domain containing protein [uncultured Eudoraea sp.]
MKFIVTLIFFIICSSTIAQDEVLNNAYSRASLSLNGEWNIIIDPYENGYYNYRYEAFDLTDPPSKNAYFTNTSPVDKTDLIEYDFDNSETLMVPGDWNSQKDKLLYYEGSIWYKRSFDYSKEEAANRVFVYFGAANYQADVYLNGRKLGRHIGGFTPFNFEVTDLLMDKGNFLVVKIDNKRTPEAVPTLNTDWWNYGGLTRDVKLIETKETYIDDYMIQLNPKNSDEILGYIQLNGPDKANREVTLKISEAKISRKVNTDITGRAQIHIKKAKLKKWSPENPKLYDVSLNAGRDQIKDKIGFRTIKTEGTSILLNNKPIFLRGICIHEESPINQGRAKTMKDSEKLLEWVKEMNGNFARLAHYPHNESMVRAADSMGILLWEENPVYWTIKWENPSTYENAQNQLTEVIQRDKNRASVIIWSMANETPVSEPRLKFLKKLKEHTRSLDPTRLISAALEQNTVDGNSNVLTIDDPFAEEVDILSFNQYIGWYVGLPDKARTITWKIDQNKPVFISEFGAGAKFGYHADKETRWSEEYQEYLYEESLNMLDKIEKLQGFSPWVLKDFRSPRRPLAKIQDGYNRKGLFDEKGNKKKAFYVLKEYYDNKANAAKGN